MQGHPAALLQPRKIPVQSRSIETVDVILQAAAQVLARQRYCKTTTNHIAERAGVSVGTIYEYFPNKDVLLTALQSYWNDICWQHLQSWPPPPAGLSLEEVLEMMVNRWVSVFRLDPALYAALVNDLPTRGNKWKADARLTLGVATVAELLCSHQHRLRITDIDLAAEVIVRGIQSYLDHLMSEQPEQINNPGLCQRITQLIGALIVK